MPTIYHNKEVKMSERDANYCNSKVGIEQDAERIFIDSDGYFNVNSNDITGDQLDKFVQQRALQSIIANSAGVLSVINLPTGQDILIFSIADAASNASAWLTSETLVVGQQRTLIARGVGSVGSIFISMSGISVVGTLSGDLSSIHLTCSATSFACVKLLATDTSEWSIVGRNTDVSGCVVEEASA